VPPSLQSLTAGFKSLTVQYTFGKRLHEARITDEKTLEQLARDVVTGQANIVEEEKETLVDRAWKAIVSSLKTMVGGSGEPLPAPA